MLELVNLSNVRYEIDRVLGGDTSALPAFFAQHGLDGLELTLYEDWEPAQFPADWIQGVHLRFWPSWMVELPMVRSLAVSMICGAADWVTCCCELKMPARNMRT